MIKDNKNLISGVFVVLLIGNVLAWQVVFDLNRPRLLKAAFFDISQGDAVFIETPQRHQILIDGGPTSAILEKLAEQMPFWDRTIDLAVLTHPETDHLNGLLEVMKGYKIDFILWTGIARDTPEYKEWRKLLGKQGARIIIARAGQKIAFPSDSSGADQAVLAVLFPFEDLEGRELKDSNETSVVSRLSFGQSSFLFTGDIRAAEEKKLIGAGAALDSDILKVGHHGSKTSSSEEFIEAVSPEIAVISAGKDNKYGHPHREVLEALEKYGVKILRTDLNGDIVITSDGSRYEIK